MNKSLEPEINFEKGLEDNIPIQKDFQIGKRFLSKEITSEDLFASNYLIKTGSFISKKLVSKKNFEDITKIARYFPSNLTSFLGFECHLGSNEPKADWAFAISGLGKDREIFSALLKNDNFPEAFLNKPEWRQISDFTEAWANPISKLNDKIQCFWLEFDMPESAKGIPIPCVFFGPTKPSNKLATNDVTQYGWLIETALPLLKGKKLYKSVRTKIENCLEKMPENAKLFQIGTMLSRSTDAVRLHINKIQPEQIIPYLNEIGWNDETGEFKKLIDELKDKADRFVISYDVTDNGIGPRIGIELSFTSNLFPNEDWSQLFNYLVEKGICSPEKRDALLEYAGTNDGENFTGAIMKPVTSSANILDTIDTAKIVRYINHVKIVYKPGQPLEAKAYPAVRLFE